MKIPHKWFVLHHIETCWQQTSYSWIVSRWCPIFFPMRFSVFPKNPHEIPSSQLHLHRSPCLSGTGVVTRPTVESSSYGKKNFQVFASQCWLILVVLECCRNWELGKMSRNPKPSIAIHGWGHTVIPNISFGEASSALTTLKHLGILIVWIWICPKGSKHRLFEPMGFQVSPISWSGTIPMW